MALEKERRKYVSLSNVLTLLAMAGAIAGTYAQSAAETARQKERVDQLKEETKEIKQEVKETNKKVDMILRKLDSWEATQRERARAERERRQ